MGVEHNPYILYQSFLNSKAFDDDVLFRKNAIEWVYGDVNHISISFLKEATIIYSFSFAFLPQTCARMLYRMVENFFTFSLQLFILPIRSIWNACKYFLTSPSFSSRKEENKVHYLANYLKKVLKTTKKCKTRLHGGQQKITLAILIKEDFVHDLFLQTSFSNPKLDLLEKKKRTSYPYSFFHFTRDFDPPIVYQHLFPTQMKKNTNTKQKPKRKESLSKSKK